MHKGGELVNRSAIHILHVEDDPGDALLMQEALMGVMGTTHYKLVHVDSLKEALNNLKTPGFNAVLLDLGLKDVDGLDNVRAIKDENPDLPIVVLTGVDCEDTAMRALQNGAQDYLIKGHGDGKVISLAIQSSIERKSAERQLYREANYDALTGLANHRLFRDYLQKTLTKAARWKRQEALMFLDLNKFKAVNDTYGHEAGNILLQMVAERLKLILRESDLIARYGGDEFVILLDGNCDDICEGCRIVANKMFDALAEPFDLNGHIAYISSSIGVAIFPTCATDANAMICAADRAMYRAKRIGPNQYCFAEEHKDAPEAESA